MRTDKELIDKQVIHGHVVPERVLFTRTVENQNEQYESLAFTDNLKVFVSMENVSNEANESMTCKYFGFSLGRIRCLGVKSLFYNN